MNVEYIRSLCAVYRYYVNTHTHTESTSHSARDAKARITLSFIVHRATMVMRFRLQNGAKMRTGPIHSSVSVSLHFSNNNRCRPVREWNAFDATAWSWKIWAGVLQPYTHTHTCVSSFFAFKLMLWHVTPT